MMVLLNRKIFCFILTSIVTAQYNYDYHRNFDYLEGPKKKQSDTKQACGPVITKTPFVTHGNTSSVGQWPWQILLVLESPQFSSMCGGSLLNEEWIISASHCVTAMGTKTVFDKKYFKIYLGKHYLKDNKDDKSVEVRKVAEIHINPKYVPSRFPNDVSLIKITPPVKFSKRIQPICLPTAETAQNNLKPGTLAMVTGWGKDEKNRIPLELQQAILKVVPTAECKKVYDFQLTDVTFCAGYKQGVYSACSGDSGGPLVFYVNSSNEQRWVLEGTVTGGGQICQLPNQYGIYGKVSKFLGWIKTVTKIG